MKALQLSIRIRRRDKSAATIKQNINMFYGEELKSRLSAWCILIEQERVAEKLNMMQLQAWNLMVSKQCFKSTIVTSCHE